MTEVECAVPAQSFEEKTIEEHAKDQIVEEGEIADITVDVHRDKEVAEGEQSDVCDVEEPTCEDEEAEESVDAVLARAMEAAEKDQADSRLCEMCKENDFKYKCPRCCMKTCSLPCSKQHKEEKNCNGERGAFTPVAKLSQFTEGRSVEDQKFIHNVHEAVHPEPQQQEDRAPCVPQLTPDGRRHQAASAQERFLIQNAIRRRIWLSFTDDKGGEDNSRHEQFSDTLFWAIDLVFRKKGADGEGPADYTYRVQNVPETLKVETIIRQFTRPKPFGPLVSKGDLDMEKMAPFVEATTANLEVFMTVPLPNMENKFYPMLMDAPILESTRDRIIVNHPKWVIVLSSESSEFGIEMLNEEECEELRLKNRSERMLTQPPRQPRQFQNNYFGGRGGFRGGRGGGFRGRGFPRGGGRGGSFGGPSPYSGPPPSSGVGMKREGEQPSQRDAFMAADGGSTFPNKRGRRGGRQSFRSEVDDFDPFNPFEGPGRVPLDSLIGASTGGAQAGQSTDSGEQN